MFVVTLLMCLWILLIYPRPMTALRAGDVTEITGECRLVKVDTRTPEDTVRMLKVRGVPVEFLIDSAGTILATGRNLEECR